MSKINAMEIKKVFMDLLLRLQINSQHKHIHNSDIKFLPIILFLSKCFYRFSALLYYITFARHGSHSKIKEIKREQNGRWKIIISDISKVMVIHGGEMVMYQTFILIANTTNNNNDTRVLLMFFIF